MAVFLSPTAVESTRSDSRDGKRYLTFRNKQAFWSRGRVPDDVLASTADPGQAWKDRRQP